MLRYFQFHLAQDVRAFSSWMPWRKVASSAAPAACAYERGRDSLSVYSSICVPVLVYVFSRTAWVSQFEMQHLQMCLVNCSPQLLSHSEGTIETKQLKELSTWGDDLVCGCACLWMSVWVIFHCFNQGFPCGCRSWKISMSQTNGKNSGLILSVFIELKNNW